MKARGLNFPPELQGSRGRRDRMSIQAFVAVQIDSHCNDRFGSKNETALAVERYAQGCGWG